MTDARYRFVLNVYDGDKQIGQGIAFLPPDLPSDQTQGFEFVHSQVYREDERTVMLVAKTTVTKAVID